METKQTTLRLPMDLYDKLKEEAERRGYSLNELILFRLLDEKDDEAILLVEE